jgi:hypothetical protein
MPARRKVHGMDAQWLDWIRLAALLALGPAVAWLAGRGDARRSPRAQMSNDVPGSD